MQNFFDQMQSTLTESDSNRSITENGAVGYRTTGKALLDLNFAVSSLRNATDGEIEARFAEALAENHDLAAVWLFFARDARQGVGERRLFRVCLRYLAQEFPETAKKLLPLVAEYGRWDDLWCLLDTTLKNTVIQIVRAQIIDDLNKRAQGKPVSLLGKWLPSETTSSPQTRAQGKIIREALHLTPRNYRKMLSNLRQYINVTERQMSSGNWGKIDYEAVPSRANLIYNNAFLRHDEERRRAYLAALEKGETKINASVLFPHDIVHKYGYGWDLRNKRPDATLEALWAALPNTVEGGESTIVVADGSGSMCINVGGPQIRAWEVAHALAIYFAERLDGPYKDKYITFSSRPQLVNLGGATTLLGKLKIASQHNECSNTDIEAVFDLILNTAMRNGLSQKDIPANVLIVSD